MRTASAVSVTRRLATIVAAMWLLADGASGRLLAQRPTSASGFRFVHVRVFDGLRTLQDTEVAVEGDTIRAIGPALPEWQRLPVIDGSGMTLLPGLIESHAHVTEADDLRQALRFGVTTVLDMGAVRVPASTVFAFRDAARSDMTMAELRSAGDPAAAPGGHDELRPRDLIKPVVATIDDAGRFAAARKAEGSDYLKIVINGVRTATTGENNLDAPRTNALVTAAHGLGMAAVAHIETVEDAELALAAGIDGLVHVWRRGAANPDLARRLAARRVWTIPAVTIPDGFMPAGGLALLADPRWQSRLTPSIRGQLSRSYAPRTITPEGLRANVDGQLAAIRSLHEAGARLLVGTDASHSNPAAFGISLHREMELLHSAGLTATEVLTAATASPAEAFRLSDRGRILPGRRADLLLVRGDPTTDVLATRDIVRVWRGGTEGGR